MQDISTLHNRMQTHCSAVPQPGWIASHNRQSIWSFFNALLAARYSHYENYIQGACKSLGRCQLLGKVLILSLKQWIGLVRNILSLPF